MSELLRKPWLEATIEQELGAVLEEWSSNETYRSQAAGHAGELYFEDDGSNLRIRSSKPRLVQICKFINHEEPFQATLSDSFTRINATISKEAAQHYAKSTRKRFTDGTVGGLIQLLGFEIVATHFGSRSKRITLFVTCFKALGANSSGSYGVPTAIEDRPQVSVLIGKLIQYREGTTTSESQSRQQTPRIASLASSPLKDQAPNSAQQASQLTFATQVPSAKSAPQVKNKSNGITQQARRSPLAAPTFTNLPDLRSLESEDAPAKRNGKDTEGSTTGQHQAVAGRKPPSTSNDELLALLRPAKEQPVMKSASVAPITPPVPPRINRPASPVSMKQASRPSHAIDQPSGEIGRETDTSSIYDTPKQVKELANERSVDPAPNLPTESLRSLNAPKSVSDEAEHQSHQQALDNVSTPRLDYDKKRSRISSREVKISKEQEALLDSEDSWIPAEPGRREPSANVPISILDSLNREADLQGKVQDLSNRRSNTRPPHDSDGNTRSPVPSNQDDQVHSESQSDDPVSASEWPPSSEDMELPPDSSMESPVLKPMVLVESRRSSQVSDHSKPPASKRSSPQREVPSTDSGAISSVAKVSDSVLDPMESPSQDHENEESSYVREITPIIVMSGSETLNHSPPIQESLNDHGGSPLEDSSHLNSPAPHASDVCNDGHDDAGGDVKLTMKPHSSPGQSFAVGSHRVKRRRLSGEVYDLPSSPVSDLEMTVPLALDDKAAIRGVPSTAPQPLEPFTQVKRTPYIINQRNERSISKKRRRSLNSSGESHQILPNGASSEEVDHVTQSIPSVTEASSAEAALIRSQIEVAQGQSPQIAGLHESVEIGASSPIDSGKICQDTDLSGLSPKQASPSPNMMIPNGVVAEGQTNNMLTENPSVGNTMSKESEPKRKASDIQPLSPNVSKRRKRFKEPVAFRDIGDNGYCPDPAARAKRFRQDSIAYDISSKNDSPYESFVPQVIMNGSPSVHVKDSDDDIPYGDSRSPDLPESGQQNAPEINADTPGAEDSLPMDHLFSDSGPRSSNRSHEMSLFESSPPINEDSGQEIDSSETVPGAQAIAADAEIDQPLVRTEDIDESQMTIPSLSLHTAARDHEASSRVAQDNQPNHADTDSAPQSQMHRANEPTAQSQLGLSVPKSGLGGPSSPAASIRNASKEQTPADLIQLKPGELQSLGSQTTSTGPDMASLIMDHLPNSRLASPELPVTTAVVAKTDNTRTTGESRSDARKARPLTIFEKFKAAYPAYSGDQKHFTAMCRKISTLLEENRMLHQAVWDDFIVRHRAEYSQYIRRCTEDVEDPMRYEDFYRNEVDQLLYQERIVTRKTLDEALSFASKHDVAPRHSEQQVSYEQNEPEPSSTHVQPAKSVHKDQAAKPPILIDLTETEEQSEVPKLPQKKPAKKEISVCDKRIRRSLPWVDDNTTLDQEPRERPNLLISRKRRQNSPPPTTASQATRQKSEPDAWWTDENAPFGAFVNSYNAICPGKGNSYAKEKPDDAQSPRKPRRRKVDPLKWEL